MTSELTVATHGMVYLLHTGRLTTSVELADNICTNSARVRKVMAKLKSAGLIDSKEGKGSGYIIKENGADITLYDILMAIQEEIVNPGWHSGDADRECLICSGMAFVMDDIYGKLNDICKNELKKVTVGDLNNQIFALKGNKEEI